MDNITLSPYNPAKSTNFTGEVKELSAASHVIVGVYLLLIGVLGTVGNILFIISVVKGPRKSTYHEVFLINLSITDTGICLTGYPWAAASSLSQRWLFGNAGCMWYGFCGFFFGVASISTLALISFDRFSTICFYNTRFHINTRKKTAVALVLVWVIALFWAVAPLVGWSRYVLEPYMTSCTVDWHGRDTGSLLLVVCLFVCIIGVNITIIITSYAGIVLTLRKRINKLESLSTISRRAEKSTVRISLMVVLGFLICWLPYAVFSMWYSFGETKHIPVGVTVIPAMLAKSSGLINPFIYAGASKKYRARLVALFCRKDHPFLTKQPKPEIAEVKNSPAVSRLFIRRPDPRPAAGVFGTSDPPEFLLIAGHKSHDKLNSQCEKLNSHCDKLNSQCASHDLRLFVKCDRSDQISGVVAELKLESVDDVNSDEANMVVTNNNRSATKGLIPRPELSTFHAQHLSIAHDESGPKVSV